MNRRRVEGMEVDGAKFDSTINAQEIEGLRGEDLVDQAQEIWSMASRVFLCPAPSRHESSPQERRWVVSFRI